MRISGSGSWHTREDTVRFAVSSLLCIRIACIRYNVEVVRSEHSLRSLCHRFETAAIRRVQHHLVCDDQRILCIDRTLHVVCGLGASSHDHKSSYRKGLIAAGFEHVEIMDSGSDLNAYGKVENQAGCCSPSMGESACCTPTATPEPTVHEELTELRSKYDVNAAAASVKVYALKPGVSVAQPCCGPNCCS